MLPGPVFIALKSFAWLVPLWGAAFGAPLFVNGKDEVVITAVALAATFWAVNSWRERRIGERARRAEFAMETSLAAQLQVQEALIEAMYLMAKQGGVPTPPGGMPIPPSLRVVNSRRD